MIQLPVDLTTIPSKFENKGVNSFCKSIKYYSGKKFNRHAGFVFSRIEGQKYGKYGLQQGIDLAGHTFDNSFKFKIKQGGRHPAHRAFCVYA